MSVVYLALRCCKWFSFVRCADSAYSAVTGSSRNSLVLRIGWHKGGRDETHMLI